MARGGEFFKAPGTTSLVVCGFSKPQALLKPFMGRKDVGARLAQPEGRRQRGLARNHALHRVA